MPATSGNDAGKKPASFFHKVLGFIIKLLQAFTVFLRYIWLLFPAVLFLFVAYACFWNLSQGRDLLISSLEMEWRVSFLLISIVFWVFITWYSSRILVYKKESLYYLGRELYKDNQPKNILTADYLLFKSGEFLGYHLPRFMGYACFTIILLAFWQLPIMHPGMSRAGAGALLLVSIGVYALFSWLFNLLARRLVKQGSIKPLAITYWAIFALFALLLSLPLFTPFHPLEYKKHAIEIMLLIFLIQHLFLFIVVNRRYFLKQVTVNAQDEAQPAHITSDRKSPLSSALAFVNVPFEERKFFLVFNGICLLAIAIYLSGVFNMLFAMGISSLNFAILAFGILVGYFSLVSIFSIHFRINFHIIFLIIVIIVGANREPHFVRLFEKKKENLQKERPDLKTYFINWAQQRKDSIAKKTYPVFFILADGGASRSGYWASSVLGRLHDQTNGKFDDHLFCLSGASGGSVGNGAYFALLHNKNKLHGKSFEKEGQDYLQHDFLSYTLARMLGPDFFRPLLPIDLANMSDRAGALERAMENATDNKCFLQHEFETQLSAFTPDISNIQIPVLCINTTRMQDGRPAVISNIKIEDKEQTFGKRIDVLKLLPHDKDINLSTAVIMGARFPYVSPAGRIDKIGKDSINYFVDGGYFDNSGAGVIHEMIVGIQETIKELKKASPANNYLDSLSFYVIHITNSPTGTIPVNKVHPLQNDLMAPLSTLVGSYGTQTDVNNSRLEKYLQLVYPDKTHYTRADLYNNILTDTLTFPMNWSISKYYQRKMNIQLVNSPQIKKIISRVKQQVE